MFRFTDTLPKGWAAYVPRFLFKPYLLAVLSFSLLPQFVNGQCTTLICAQNVQFSLGNDCSGSVNPVSMLANYWSCQGPLTMTYYDAWGNNLGSTLTSAQLGQTVDVHVKHNWTGLTCWGTVFVKDGKKPTITTSNVTLNCTEDPSPAALDPPSVADNCSPANQITLTHQDTVLDFGCGYTGFSGYFAPNNWDICLTANGDGGVDVTGAPNSVLVEGANSSPISTTSSYVTRFKIVIPTEGYVSFDWSSFGGSSFSNEGVYLTINNWCIRLSSDTLQSGSYTTGLLHPGDVLSFEQYSNGSSNANSTIFSNFHFQTLAWKVIQRKWIATDAWGNTSTKVQTITLNRATLSQVIFPKNRDGVQAPMLACGANVTDPTVTGMPFIDEDGNPATTSDQYAVDNGDCFFNLTFTDQVITTCEGSELILRKWTVLDGCSNDFVEHTQIIKLFDVTPPTITCPLPVTLGTDDFGCFGVINLPSATAIDDCSSTININPTWAFGNGFGPFANVPQGTHTVSYHATDACGNTSYCNTTVTVVDDVAPTAICQGFTVASLTNLGEATVHAIDLDAGSYDHCCLQAYEVKRASQSDASYATTLTVSCADLSGNGSVLVTLRLTDCHGNANTCNVTINVHDELPPVIVPPADVVVDCNTDLSNPAAFGLPTVSDNCTFTLNETITPNVTSCGQGTVTRLFTATDASGNVSNAQQVIHLVNQSPWNSAGNQIVWPVDYTSQACSGESLEPFDLPYPYNGPTLLGQNGCENVAVNFEDEIFWISEPACYKIIRTWTILDWCVYQANSNNNAGMWTHEQIIQVVDNQAPVFENPAPTFTATSGAGCTGNVFLPLPAISDCSNHVTITASGSLGNGFSFQNVPVGIYPMTYFASDGCGNTSQHSFTVLVGDNIAPTAYCNNGIVVPLNAQGQATLTAQQLNANSFDDCAPANSLQFSFSQNTSVTSQNFTCANIGPYPVQLWVTDPGGNSDFCETIVTVQDNMSACAGGVALGGMVQLPNGQPIGQVTVNISGVNMPAATTQSGVGSYTFQGLAYGGDFTVTPSKNTGLTNGVTSFDLAKISEHILGVNPFPEAWQSIAADGNGSGMVTTQDLVAIQGVILGVFSNFPNGTPSWRFVPANHVFANPGNPWPFPQEISLNDVSQDLMDVHFTGIKTGDVSGNVNPFYLVGNTSDDQAQEIVEGRNSGETAALRAKEQSLAKGETKVVEFEMSEAMAWQLSLFVDPHLLEIQGMEASSDGVSPIFNDARKAEGLVSLLHYGQATSARFFLKIRALANVKLSDAIRLAADPTPTAVWSTDEAQMGLVLDFEDNGEADFISLKCQPNPFESEANLSFHLSEDTSVDFRFYDLRGKQLFHHTGDFKKGQNNLTLQQADLSATGVVILNMEANGKVVTEKLVIVE